LPEKYTYAKMTKNISFHSGSDGIPKTVS